jgi:hypothetical protein
MFFGRCVGHPQDIFCLRNVNIIFFPSVCAVLLRLLDHGMVLSFKYHSIKLLVRKAVAMIGHQLLQNATLMDFSMPMHFTSWQNLDAVLPFLLSPAVSLISPIRPTVLRHVIMKMEF